VKEQLKAVIKAELIKEAGEKNDRVGWGNAAATYIPGMLAGKIPGIGLATGPAVQHMAVNIDRHMQGKKPTQQWLGTAWDTGVGEMLGFGLGTAVSTPIIAHQHNALLRAIEKRFGPEAAATAVRSPEFLHAIRNKVAPIVAPLIIAPTLAGGYLAHHAARNRNEK